jgi:hypothetical protein
MKQIIELLFVLAIVIGVIYCTARFTTYAVNTHDKESHIRLILETKCRNGEFNSYEAYYICGD